jgi:hypothetical protein
MPKNYIIASRLEGTTVWYQHNHHSLPWLDDDIEAASALVALSNEHTDLEFTLFECTNIMGK